MVPGCNRVVKPLELISHLIERGGDADFPLINEIGTGGAWIFTTVVYGVKAGSYYLEVTTDNDWVVTFTPLA